MIKNLENILIFILFCFIIFILSFNVLHYDPIFGYDGEAHHEYVQNFLIYIHPGQMINCQKTLLMNFLAHHYLMFFLLL